MKTINSLMFVVIIYLLLFSCSVKKKNNPIIYDDKVININFTTTDWYTSINKYSDSLFFGKINLKIAGSTDADSVFIKTFGDGLISWQNLNINSSNVFSDDINISFTPFNNSPIGTETNSKTILKAIKDTDTLIVDLKSGKLIY